MPQEKLPAKGKKLKDRILDGLGRRLMEDPLINSAITDKARSNAAAKAYEDTEPTMQKLAALRKELREEIRRQEEQS